MHSLKRYVAKMSIEINKSIKYYDRISNKVNNRTLAKLTRIFDPSDTIRTKTVNKKRRDVIDNMRASIEGDVKK